MRILMIEDEQCVAVFIRKGLEEQSFIVDMAYDGASGKRLTLQNDYDVVLLDIILPEMNGLQVCKGIREYRNVPILMLTSLGIPNDVVPRLNMGADDYLAKPFKFQELVTRINALARRKF